MSRRDRRAWRNGKRRHTALTARGRLSATGRKVLYRHTAHGWNITGPYKGHPHPDRACVGRHFWGCSRRSWAYDRPGQVSKLFLAICEGTCSPMRGRLRGVFDRHGFAVAKGACTAFSIGLAVLEWCPSSSVADAQDWHPSRLPLPARVCHLVALRDWLPALATIPSRRRGACRPALRHGETGLCSR